MELFNKYFALFKSIFLKNLDFRSALGFVISGVLLWLTFYNSGLHLRDLRLSGSELFYFVLGDGFFLVSVWIYSIRNKLYWLNDQRGFKNIQSFDSVVIGNFYNCLLPGNLGEGMRAWHFGKKNRIPFLQSMSSILAEKWIDAQLFVGLTIGLLMAMPFSGDYILYTIILTSVAVIVLSAIYILMRKSKRVERIVISLMLLFKKPGKIFFKLYWFTSRLIREVIYKGRLSRYMGLCLTLYFFNVLQFFFLLKAAGVVSPVGGFYSAYLIAMCMMIITIIPSAPSNIGVLHYGVYLALIMAAGQYGIKPDAAQLQSYARFAVYVHLSYVIPEVTMGVLFVIKERKILF